MVTLGVTILFAVIVAISAIVGLIRGLHKSVIRLMLLVLAVILTFVIAGPVTTALAQNIMLEGQTLGEIILESISGSDMMSGLFATVPLMQEAIRVIPAFVLGIVVFPVVFLLLRFVSWIVFLFVQKPLRKLIFKEGRNQEEGTPAPAGMGAGKRFAGMGVGVVAGVLIFGIITMPMLGLFSILPEKSAVDETLDTMVSQNMVSAADAGSVQEAYAVTDNAIVKFYNLIGATSAGGTYMNSVSKIEAAGQTAYLAEELSCMLATVQTAMEGGLLDALMADADPEALGSLLADKTFTDKLIQDMSESQILRSFIPNIMSMAMESFTNSVGGSEGSNDEVTDVMGSILTDLMNNKDAEDFGQQVSAMLSIYNLATTGVEQFTQDDISGLIDLAAESDDIYDMLMEVAQENPFGIEIDDATVQQELIGALEESSAQSGQNQRQQDVCNAIAALLGLKAEVNFG